MSHSLTWHQVTPRATAQREVKLLLWKGIIGGGSDPAMNPTWSLQPTTSAGHGGGPVGLWHPHGTSRPHWEVLAERGAETWVQDLLLRCCRPASGTSRHEQPGLCLQPAFPQGHPLQCAAPIVPVPPARAGQPRGSPLPVLGKNRGSRRGERPLPGSARGRAPRSPLAARPLAVNQRISPAQHSRCQTAALAFVSPS